MSNVQHFNITAIGIGVAGILALMVFKSLNQRYLPHLPLPSQVCADYIFSVMLMEIMLRSGAVLRFFGVVSFFLIIFLSTIDRATQTGHACKHI